MTVIGIDAASLRNMNKPLKWIGIFIVVFIVLAVIFEPPKSTEQKAAEATTREQQSAKQPIRSDAQPQPTELLKTITSAFGWVSFACFALAAFIEPNQPKRDGRFKTGFKNNATVRRKSPSEIRLQRGTIAIGAITGIIWYFVR